MFSFLNNIGSTEIILLAIVLVVLFGSQFLMKMARSSGETVRELKRAKKEFTEAVMEDDDKSSKAHK